MSRGYRGYQNVAALEIPEGYYTLQQAAQALGVNRRTMQRWVTDGKITTDRLPGVHVRYVIRKEVLCRFARNHDLPVPS